MGLSDLPLDMALEAFLVVAALAVILLAIAPVAAEALIRWRARRLPPHLSERFTEEWIAEVREIETRARKLSYALAIALTRTQTLTDAETSGASLAIGARQVLLSVEDVRVHSDFGNRFPAMLVDVALWFGIALAAQPFRPGDPAASGAYGLAVYAAGMLLMQVLCVVRFGGSPGKLLLKLRIVPTGDGPLTVRHALLRIAPECALVLTGYDVSFYAL
jgi:hypothetical protein